MLKNIKICHDVLIKIDMLCMEFEKKNLYRKIAVVF